MNFMKTHMKRMYRDSMTGRRDASRECAPADTSAAPRRAKQQNKPANPCNNGVSTL